MYQTGKKLLSLLLAISMLLALCVTAGAKENGVTVTLDGEILAAEAYIDANGRTQVSAAAAEKLGIKLTLKAGDTAGDTTVVDGYFPLRYVAEANGYQVAWDAASRTAKLTSATDFDSIEALEIDWSQAAQLPLTGYFTKSFDDGRSVKVYIAEEASIRSYFTVVAVPDGVNTKEFLESEGWFALADAKGEGLFVLEPGKNGWGSAADESSYVNEAIGFLKGGRNAKGVAVFTTFGEFYLAGYGKGAAALELWAAENPILVIAQAYVNGTGVDAKTLNALGAAKYDGIKAGGYADIPDFEGTLSKVGMKQIGKAEVPVPSWFVGYPSDSENIAYWKSANDCVKNADNSGAYYQDIKSDAYQTEHANAELLKLNANAKYGISQVKVTSGDVTAADIYAFLSTYTRYENSFAYANTLAYRVDYTAARVSAQQQAKDGKTIASYASTNYKGEDTTVELWGKGVTKAGKGTFQFGVFTFTDNNGDGKNDPREYMVYVPNGYTSEKMPIVVVYPGNTQTDSIFFDCTQWYQVADREGFILAFVCESYSSPVAVTHMDQQYYQTALMTILHNEIDGKYATLDFNRVYGTGQSLGSMSTQGMARTNPEFFAAVASTSGVMDMGFGEDSGKLIPTFMLTGQSDLEFLLPDLWNSESLPEWANYFLKANGAVGTLDKHDSYQMTKIHSFDRSEIYTWNNEAGIPVFSWGMTLMRAHNCYAGEMELLWDYLEHFSFEVAADGTVTRYYSASAFAADDAVVIK